jgi:hypothetical protein
MFTEIPEESTASIFRVTGQAKQAELQPLYLFIEAPIGSLWAHFQACI